MRHEAVDHENFFIAKNRDSESAQRARRSVNARITKTSAAQSLLAILTTAGVGFLRAIRITAPMQRGDVDERSSRSLASPRQHFLKQDAVFFNVLVYSGCSAFDSRVHAAIKPSH
jgi:hypothetical protein